MTVNAWVHFLGDDAARLRSTIVEALHRASVVERIAGSDGRWTSGIVAFSKVDHELCDFLAQAADKGAERILAVAVSGSVLSHQNNEWRVLQAGAADVLAWDELRDPAGVIAQRLERWDRVDRMADSALAQRSLIGSSRVWRSVLRQIVEIAHFTNATVLLLGETGTGKEEVARLIHDLDSRTNKRNLVVVDCTTIVPELSGSEFFGHERGAFTGATAPRDGSFALADGGTLFLDEVGDLPLPLQAQLLRAVQEHTYKRVGGNVWHHTTFRLICATHRNLQEAVRQGRFRDDLYYRIASWVCRLPPLRERPEDIPILAQSFLEDFLPERPLCSIASSVRIYLMSREYPGNVRELKQLMGRICSRHVGGGPITLGDIPDADRPSQGMAAREWRKQPLESAIRTAFDLGVGLKDLRRTVEDMAIRLALDEANGSLPKAALRLGITDRALQLRMAARREVEQILPPPETSPKAPMPH